MNITYKCHLKYTIQFGIFISNKVLAKWSFRIVHYYSYLRLDLKYIVEWLRNANVSSVINLLLPLYLFNGLRLWYHIVHLS